MRILRKSSYLGELDGKVEKAQAIMENYANRYGLFENDHRRSRS